MHRDDAVTEQSPMAKSPEDDRDSRRPRERSDRNTGEVRSESAAKVADKADDESSDDESSDDEPSFSESAAAEA